LLAAGLLGVASPVAGAAVLRNLDFQAPSLLDANGHPTQWDNYVPEPGGTSGVSLGSPGVLPAGYVQAARFQPPNPQGRPRSQAKLAKDSKPDPGVAVSGPLDAAQGLERWYLWYTYFPPDFDIPADAPKDAPTILQAWHNNSQESPCNPNVQLHVKRNGPADDLRVLLKVQGGRHSDTPPKTWTAEGSNGTYCYTETYKEIDLGPVVRGQWIQFGMHVRWNSAPSAGLTEIWRDGQLTSIPGANLYRSDAGVPEQGFLEQGIYMPKEATDAARARSVWHVGMRVASAAADVEPQFGPPILPPAPVGTAPPPAQACRALHARTRRIRLMGRRVTVRISTRATTSEPAVVRVSYRGHVLRRASVRIQDTHLRLRHRRASLPVSAFTNASRVTVKVRLTPRRGRAHTLTMRVSSAPCA
jgi:hypothetical protein